VYLTSRSAVAASDDSIGSPATKTRVDSNVVALGAVSLVTDISSEMVTAILPLYFVFTLGMSPLTFGFLDGLYNGVTSFVQLASGHVSDRSQRRKLIAGSGYGLSAVCKLGLLAAGRSVPWLGAVLAVDRTGKGIRTAPRDALITLSSRPENLGRSFGVHRAMDTVGALLGPLIAFLILAKLPDGYDAIFVVSFCIAVFGVGILVVTVRDRPVAIVGSVQPGLRAALQLLRRWRFSALCGCAVLLAFAQISDAFVYLLLQRRYDLALGLFPLLSLGTALGFLLLAIPLGRLADRIGRARVFVAGHLALIGVYLVIQHGPRGWPFLIIALALHGIFYAATDGVLMAYAGPLIPEQLRTSGLALVQTGMAVANLASSALFGLLWQHLGPAGATRIFEICLVAAVVVSAVALPVRSRA
jgi:MFS family permease